MDEAFMKHSILMVKSSSEFSMGLILILGIRQLISICKFSTTQLTFMGNLKISKLSEGSLDSPLQMWNNHWYFTSCTLLFTPCVGTWSTSSLTFLFSGGNAILSSKKSILILLICLEITNSNWNLKEKKIFVDLFI